MGRLFVTLIAVTALVAVPAALSRAGTASRVVRFATVPPGATRTLTVRCAAGSVAASAGVQSAGLARTLAIRPSGARTVEIRLANSGANPPQRTAVSVSCLHLARGATAPRFQVTQVRSRRLAVPAHGARSALLRCPSGTLAAGAGFDVFSAPLEIIRETRTLTSFSFTVRNDGTRGRPAVLYGTCLTLLRPPGAPRVKLNVRVITATISVGSGDQTVTQSCPSGWFGLATGFSLPASVTLSASVAVPGGGRWSLTNPFTKALLADVQLVCGRVA